MMYNTYYNHGSIEQSFPTPSITYKISLCSGFAKFGFSICYLRLRLGLELEVYRPVLLLPGQIATN